MVYAGGGLELNFGGVRYAGNVTYLLESKPSPPQSPLSEGKV